MASWGTSSLYWPGRSPTTSMGHNYISYSSYPMSSGGLHRSGSTSYRSGGGGSSNAAGLGRRHSFYGRPSSMAFDMAPSHTYAPSPNYVSHRTSYVPSSWAPPPPVPPPLSRANSYKSSGLSKASKAASKASKSSGYGTHGTYGYGNYGTHGGYGGYTNNYADYDYSSTSSSNRSSYYGGMRVGSPNAFGMDSSSSGHSSDKRVHFNEKVKCYHYTDESDRPARSGSSRGHRSQSQGPSRYHGSSGSNTNNTNSTSTDNKKNRGSGVYYADNGRIQAVQAESLLEHERSPREAATSRYNSQSDYTGQEELKRRASRYRNRSKPTNVRVEVAY